MSAATMVVLAVLVGLVTVGSPPTQAAPRQAVTACTNAELRASYHLTDSGMSHRYGRIVLKNVSDHACRIGGYGGLSYVGGGDGTQVGAPADRVPGRVRSLLVRPGAKVVSRVAETDASAYPERRCRPAPVDGFRVYVPNETESQYVAHPTTGCRNDGVHLLTHKAYRRP